MLKKKGFTLIELVVVMAIIAVLSLLIIAAITAARRASVETQRRGNVKTVETALETRYTKCGAYTGNPRSLTGATCASVGGTTANSTTDFAALVSALNTEGYLDSTQLNGVNNTDYTAAVTGAENFTLEAEDDNNVVIYTATR